MGYHLFLTSSSAIHRQEKSVSYIIMPVSYLHLLYMSSFIRHKSPICDYSILITASFVIFTKCTNGCIMERMFLSIRMFQSENISIVSGSGKVGALH